MELINDVAKIGKKEFPVRIHKGEKPEYLIVTHHGLLSNKTTYRYLEKWAEERAIIVSYDARVNGDNKLRASRMMSTYTRDLKDVVQWAKGMYPGIKVITLGSSWGAAVVVDFARKYPTIADKNVAWSIPYDMFGAEEGKETQAKAAEAVKELNKEVGKPLVKETTHLGYAWRFALMLSLNINTKSYTKIDLDKTAANKALARINKIVKPQATPVKLFWATFKSVARVFKNFEKINKAEKHEFLYIQSTIDSYLKSNSLEKLKSVTGQGVDVIYLNEGRHAFQWEKENDLNVRVFQMVFDWLEINK